MEGRVWSPSGMLNFEFEKAVRQWLIGADNVSGSLVCCWCLCLIWLVHIIAGCFFWGGHVVA